MTVRFTLWSTDVWNGLGLPDSGVDLILGHAQPAPRIAYRDEIGGAMDVIALQRFPVAWIEQV